MFTGYSLENTLGLSGQSDFVSQICRQLERAFHRRTFYITRRAEEECGEERAHELGRRWLLYRRGEVKRGRASVESIRRWVEGLCTLQCRNLPENQDFHQLSDKDGNSTGGKR